MHMAARKVDLSDADLELLQEALLECAADLIRAHAANADEEEALGTRLDRLRRIHEHLGQYLEDPSLREE